MKMLISALAFGSLALAIGFGDCKKDKEGEDGLTVAVLGEDCKDKEGEDSFAFLGDDCKDKDGEDSLALSGDDCKDKDGEELTLA
jgi:hypothetical protein